MPWKNQFLKDWGHLQSTTVAELLKVLLPRFLPSKWKQAKYLANGGWAKVTSK